jgi:hypothetical protein
MSDLTETQQSSQPSLQSSEPTRSTPGSWFRKLRGGFLFAVGWLLSPLCWWNDLIFNLPIAYLFGYLFSWISADLFLPFTIAGYWLSNIAGILLMQAGVLDVLQGQAKERNLKKELLTGIATSTAYTLVILALVYFKILDTPSFLTDGSPASLSSLLPKFFSGFNSR